MEAPKKNKILNSLSNDEKLIHQSKHLLLELYRCDYEKLNDESFLRCTLNRAAKLAKATSLNLKVLQRLLYWLNPIFQYTLGRNLIILLLISLHVGIV